MNRQEVRDTFALRATPGGCEICDGQQVVGGSHGVPAHPCSHCQPLKYKQWATGGTAMSSQEHSVADLRSGDWIVVKNFTSNDGKYAAAGIRLSWLAKVEMRTSDDTMRILPAADWRTGPADFVAWLESKL